MILAMDLCDECGFVYEEVASGEVPGTLRGLAEQYANLLLRPELGGFATTRPAPEVWSPLEYICHVRDVLLIQRDRVLLALVEDTPSYPRMYRDERVSLVGYQREAIEEVVHELEMAANLMAKLIEGLSPEQLQRPCTYNFPEPTVRDVVWLGRHTVHEVAHHLADVRLGLEQLKR